MYKKILSLIFIFIIISGSITRSNYANGIDDTTPPVITLVGDNPQKIEVGSTYIELGATVYDPDNSGLTATIDSSEVNTTALGTYTVKYNAVDLAGNNATQVTRIVNVVDTTLESPSLNNDTLDSWKSSSFSPKLVSNDNSSISINNVEQIPQLTLADSGNPSAINSSLISEPSVLLNTNFATLTNGSAIVNTIGLENYTLPNSTDVVVVIPTIVTSVNATSGSIVSTP